MEIRSRVGYSTAAVPLEYMTFSNGDYSALQLDLGGIWKPFSWGRLALNTLYLAHPERIVDQDMSVFSPYSCGNFKSSRSAVSHLDILSVVPTGDVDSRITKLPGSKTDAIDIVAASK